MANFIEHARTNYFKVKNAESFKNAVKTLCGVELIQDSEGRFGLLFDEGTVMTLRDDSDEFDDIIDVHPEDFLPQFMEDGEVCIIQSVGYEKMRYLSGYAYAFDSNFTETKKTVSVNINSIYNLAKEEFDKEDISEAVY